MAERAASSTTEAPPNTTGGIEERVNQFTLTVFTTSKKEDLLSSYIPENARSGLLVVHDDEFFRTRDTKNNRFFLVCRDRPAWLSAYHALRSSQNIIVEKTSSVYWRRVLDKLILAEESDARAVQAEDVTAENETDEGPVTPSSASEISREASMPDAEQNNEKRGSAPPRPIFVIPLLPDPVKTHLLGQQPSRTPRTLSAPNDPSSSLSIQSPCLTAYHNETEPWSKRSASALVNLGLDEIRQRCQEFLEAHKEFENQATRVPMFFVELFGAAKKKKTDFEQGLFVLEQLGELRTCGKLSSEVLRDYMILMDHIKQIREVCLEAVKEAFEIDAVWGKALD